jgi:hypothetical protein
MGLAALNKLSALHPSRFIASALNDKFGSYCFVDLALKIELCVILRILPKDLNG